mgnify:CR=1 FL=1
MDMSDKWHLQWDMDGCQWEVLDIKLFEEWPSNCNSMHTGTWSGCLWFVYQHLMADIYSVRKLKIFCKDDYFEIDKNIIANILKEYYPEEFI